MNGTKILLDSTGVIKYLRNELSLDDIGGNGIERYISIITRMEALSYPDITPDEEKRAHDFLSSCTVIPLDQRLEQEVIQFRRSSKRKLPDSIIAATAALLGITLLSHDPHLLKAVWPGLTVVDSLADKPTSAGL
jgi:predicted nucleic acid-binding protein